MQRFHAKWHARILFRQFLRDTSYCHTWRLAMTHGVRWQHRTTWCVNKKALSDERVRWLFWKASLPLEKARQKDARARECTWPSFVLLAVCKSVKAGVVEYGVARIGGEDEEGEGRVYGASFVFSRGSPTRWRRCLETVGIRDMCVPTHAVLVVRTRGGNLVVFGKRRVTEGKKERGKTGPMLSAARRPP